MPTDTQSSQNFAQKSFEDAIGVLSSAAGINPSQLFDAIGISGSNSGYFPSISDLSIADLYSICDYLRIRPSVLFSEIEGLKEAASAEYLVNDNFNIDCGFVITGSLVASAVNAANKILSSLPHSLFRTIDLKSLSGMVGAVFAQQIASICGAMVNPIEKGHPDVLPLSARSAKDSELMNYPSGLEIKCTVGNMRTGTKLKSGHSRVDYLSAVTWQAHHQEVHSLMGLVIDFASSEGDGDRFPMITAIFYSSDLKAEDWGAISGTQGRNTKVCGMTASGKSKMGKGAVLVLDNNDYKKKYSAIIGLGEIGATKKICR